MGHKKSLGKPFGGLGFGGQAINWRSVAPKEVLIGLTYKSYSAALSVTWLLP